MSDTPKKLFLFDAMALIYRAHFAFSKNPRINSKGMNTGACLGFTNALVEVINKQKPTHMAVVFDAKGPTFRHEVFPEYKGNRPPQPEDIKISIPVIKEIVKAFRIPGLELQGYEADDIIGTFAKIGAKQDMEVFMMTPDKDFAQLVEEKIFLYKPAYMGNAVDIMGVEEVKAKYELDNVDQMRDYLGLMGDAADNIKGIPGVGKKTAVKFLKAYGTIENLLKHTDELKGKMKERVEEHGQEGIKSKELVTIDINVPIEFVEEDLRYDGPDEAKLRAIFEDLEFRTLINRVLGTTASKKATPKAKKGSAPISQLSMFGGTEEVAAETDEQKAPIQKDNIFSKAHDYHLMDTPELRQRLIKFLKLQKEYCFDTETTGIDPIEAHLVGIAFSYEEREAFYVPIPEDFEEAKAIAQEFKEVFEDSSILVIGQNLKYDILVLKKYGIDVAGPYFDTMLAHYLIQPDMRHNMDVLAENYLNYEPVPISTLIGKKGKNQKSMRDIPVSEVVEYAGEDADITYQLKHKLHAQLQKLSQEELYNKVEIPLVPVLADMEFNGIRLDPNALKEQSVIMEKSALELKAKIYEQAGEEFNIGSPKQLGEILFDKLKLDPKAKKTKTKQYATGEEILSRLAGEHQIAADILMWRQVQKLRSTYLDALPLLISPTDDLIHTSYNQAVAATGRLSSTNPNLQNIPIRTENGREIRKAFVPRGPEFTLMAADYSQVELRIMAAFSEDETMIEAFRQGKDIHTATASKVFKVPLEEVDVDLRRKAKTANFGIIYGISAFGLSQRLKIPRKEAAEIIKNYFEEFPKIKAYMDTVINQAREFGYVETILGRRRYLRDINSQNFTLRGYAERNAINAPIQGSAADVIKMAMINIHAWMKEEKLQSKMLLQVHDELVFDVHESEKELMSTKIPEFMSNAVDLSVPLEVEFGFGGNWLDAH